MVIKWWLFILWNYWNVRKDCKRIWKWYLYNTTLLFMVLCWVQKIKFRSWCKWWLCIWRKILCTWPRYSCFFRIIILDTDGDLKGKETIYEDLRQICMKNVNGISMWWEYMKYFKQECFNENKTFVPSCYTNVFFSMELDVEPID